jgi:chemotaxis protein CheD
MKTLPFKHTNRIIIDPGEFYVSTQQEVISTLLGSCVAACLYDPVNNIIGMNHFLLAQQHAGHGESVIESDEGRYGMYAMELLINAMTVKGANKMNIKAKCFGGGNVLQLRTDGQNKKTVGDLNIEFIKAYLMQEKIPMMGSQLGGNLGRNVHFVGDDFAVYVKVIGDTRKRELEKEELKYWAKTRDEHEKETSSSADFF